MTVLAASDVSTNWTTPLPTYSSYGSPCLAHDQVWLCLGKFVYGYDRLTGKQTHQLGGFNGSARAVRPFEGGLLVASTDSNLYKVDIDGSAAPRPIATYVTDPGWVETQAGSVYLYAVNTGLWRVPPTAEKIPPTKDGQIVGGIGKNTSNDFPVAAPDAVFLARAPNFIDVLNPLTLAVRNTITLAGTSMADLVGGACNGPVTCFVVNEKTVLAIDATQRNVSWRTEANAKLTSACAVDAKYCYAGTTDGRIFALDIVTGKAVRQLRLGTGEIKRLWQDNGIVYAVCTDDHGRRDFLYAADPQTGTVAKHETGVYGSIVGVDNGVVYYVGGRTLGAVRLADLVREFYAESVLVQDFAFTPNQPAEKKPAIHTEITLYDRGGSPWAMQTVKVGSTSPITIESGGTSYAIDSAKSADLKTDGSGKLRIGMPAGDVDSKGVFRKGLTSPALTLFTSFMSANERVLVRPDAQLHDELGKVTGERLQNATGYDGGFVVADNYRRDTKVMANVAGMIGATTSMVKDSLDNRKMLLADSGKRYLAPGCDMETICCCKAGDYDCKLVCNKAFAVDLDLSGSTFSYLETKEQIERWLKDHPVSQESLLMSWGDFWDAVKNGAAKVTNAIIYAAKQIEKKAKDVVKTVVTAVINGIQTTMDFVVDTIEHAVSIVHGIFNTIAGAVDKVLEALSLIFDWQGIVTFKNNIKSNIEKSFTRLLTPQTAGGKSLLTQARERGNQAFSDLGSKLDNVLDDLSGSVGKDSGSSVQNRTAGKYNPAKGGATSNWLQSKMNDNLLSDQAVQTHALSAGAAGSAIHIPTFTLPDGLEKDISAFLKDLQTRVTGDVSDSIQRLQSALGDSNSDLFSQTFHFFLELVRGTLHVGLDVVSAVFDGAMRLLEKMLGAAWSFIRDQKITIPFVSDLYWSFTGSDLTGLDLACLLIAIPGSLVAAATSSGRRAGANGLARLSGILAGCGQVVWSLISGAVGAASALFADKIENYSTAGKILFGGIRFLLIAGFGLAARGLFLWSDIETSAGNDDALLINTVLWAFPTLAIVVDLGGIALGSTGKLPWAPNVASVMVCATGVCMGGLLAWFFFRKWVQAPLVLTFNALVMTGLIVRLGTIFEPWWVKLGAITITTGLIAGSGVVKIIDASGVLTTEELMPGTAESGREQAYGF